MDDNSEVSVSATEDAKRKSEESCEALLRDPPSSRSGISKVTLRLPFKSESFKAQSLLARFHSSRKSESGIKSDIKPNSNGSGLGFARRWRRQKSGNNFETLENIGVESETTSSSLPDDLNQNINVTLNESSQSGAIGDESRGSDELGPPISRCLSEESGFMPVGSQRTADNLFGTWPGRPRKLKNLKKRLLASGPNQSFPEPVTSAKIHDSEKKEDSHPLPQHVSVDQNEELYDFSTKKDTTNEMKSTLVEVPTVLSQHVSLDALLESLPLIYDPTTKQLCLATPKKGRPDSSVTRMSSANIGNSEGEFHLELLHKLGANKGKSEFCGKDEESLKEFLSKNSDSTEAPTIPKPLEIIQEVDENGETIRLIDSSAPQSGNVSGSSSLERGTYESVRNSLQRIGTSNSLSITDASSFSSLSSSNTELSVYSASDSAVCLASHHSDTASLPDFVPTDNDGKSKKRGIADFLSRNLFSWRHKDGGGGSDGASSTSSSSPVPTSPVAASSPGWRIFSLTHRVARSPDFQGRNSELEAGSAGLIMETRPTSLPAKTYREQLKHHQEYQAMVSAARKKELREAKERKKVQASLQRQEEQMAAAVAFWNNEIIPKWDHMRTHKKCRELWWHGLPSCVRGRVWKLAIGNDLNITPQLYNIMVQRSVDKIERGGECSSMGSEEWSDPGDQEATVDLIRLDVSRTFPHLCIFQKGGPYHDPLHSVLGAYACYRPDVGYVQGMSFLAATLLLNMSEVDAFTAFTNLINRPAHMAFFRVDQPMMEAYYQTFEELLMANLPQLADHLHSIGVTPDLYVLDWLLTVFARPLPLDAAVRIWDVYLRDGEEFLLRVAIGILKLYEGELREQECTATAAQFLTRLPDDLCADSLFRTLNSVRTSVHKRPFATILQTHMDVEPTPDPLV